MRSYCQLNNQMIMDWLVAESRGWTDRRTDVVGKNNAKEEQLAEGKSHVSCLCHGGIADRMVSKTPEDYGGGAINVRYLSTVRPKMSRGGKKKMCSCFYSKDEQVKKIIQR